jgi:hypothetical protein
MGDERDILFAEKFPHIKRRVAPCLIVVQKLLSMLLVESFAASHSLCKICTCSDQ